MGVGKKLLSKTFDLLYFAKSRKKICRKFRKPDTFDGLVYTIPEFHKMTSAFFDDPSGFYGDFRPNGVSASDKLNLREGTHYQDHAIASQDNMRRLLFDSPVVTEWPETDLTPFKWFTREEKPARTILLFVPGWGRNSQSVEDRMCRQLREAGVDAGLFTVPYQQARTPVGSFTGEYFISANLFWTVENFRHFVAEIRLIIQYMREQYEYVGLIGQSSGGFQACLAANCETVDFLFPYMTGCRLGSLTWHGMLTQYLKKDAITAGFSEDDLNSVWSISDQRVLGKTCQAKLIKNYISLYDSAIPTEYQFELWEALGKNEKMELECAHYSSFAVQHRVIQDIVSCVRDHVD